MQLKRKRWRLKSYEQCFSGAEALEWLHTYLQNHPSFGAHVTREQGFMLLQKFMENNVFQNAVSKQTKKFQDTSCLYKFMEQDHLQKQTENVSKENKQDKENFPPQNSLSNLFKNLGRRNSRTISTEEYQQTPVGKDVCHRGPPPLKYDDTSRSRIVDSCMTPLALDMNNISMTSARNTEQKAYADMSTFLFDPAEEDQMDIFDTSISQSHFKRSNSLCLHKKEHTKSSKSQLSVFLEHNGDEDVFKEPIKDKELYPKPVIMKNDKKRAIRRKFGKGSSNSQASRRHTVTLGKRQSTNTDENIVASPPKKMKGSNKTAITPDSNLTGNKGYMSSLLPRKAVVVLGEKPSFIKEMESYASYEVANLPGYKPSQTLHNQICQNKPHKLTLAGQLKQNQIEQLSARSVDHKCAYANPLVESNMGSDVRISKMKKKVKKTDSLPQAPFVPLCSSENTAISPRLTRYSPKVTKYSTKVSSSRPVRHRSFSQDSLLLKYKCQSVNDIHQSNYELNKLKKTYHKSTTKLADRVLYKAPSMWSINTIGLNEEKNSGDEQKKPTEITSEDIEETWKSVVFLSLKKLLGIERISDFLDDGKILGKDIMRNVNWEASEIYRDAPGWLLSAMNCLMDWPNSNQNTEDSVLQDLPNYPGFERDVYRAIKEHYHSTLSEPIISCHLYPLLQEFAEIMHYDVDGAIRLFQHLTLLLPCWNRRQLQLLARFMNGIENNETLEISKDLPNRDLVIHSFFRLIGRKEKHAISVGFHDAVSIRTTTFLIDHYDAVFKAPSGLRFQVDHKLAVTLGAPSFTKHRPTRAGSNTFDRPSSVGDQRYQVNGPRSYCVQISKQEYEKEAKELSQKAIRGLLTSIMDDKCLSETERNIRLKQFQKAYPDIYADRFSCDDISNCSTISQRSTNFKHALKPSFLVEKLF